MHPHINFGTKILRDLGKKIAKAFDLSCDYAGTDHQDIRKQRDGLIPYINESLQTLLSESFSSDQVIFARDAENTTNLPEKYWLFDALCSPENMDHQIPLISMSLCFVEGRHTTHAVVYNPISDEVFSASRGDGAQYNHRRLRHNPKHAISMLFYEQGASSDFDLTHLKVRSLGSASLSVIMTAANRGDICLLPTSLLNQPFLNAAKLIAREAGLNFFKKDNGVTWICSSSHLDRQTFELKFQPA